MPDSLAAPLHPGISRILSAADVLQLMRSLRDALPVRFDLSGLDRVLRVDSDRQLIEVQAAIRRSRGWCHTNSRPSLTSSTRGRRSDRGGGVSTCSIRLMKNAEARKLTASIAMATGAPKARMRKPAVAGPATWRADTSSSPHSLPA